MLFIISVLQKGFIDECIYKGKILQCWIFSHFASHFLHFHYYSLFFSGHKMGLYQHHLEIPKELLKKDYGFSMDFGGFTDIHIMWY